jgi:TetR/AcrR family transcriptional regulator, transcriptional repressor for nem operon
MTNSDLGSVAVLAGASDHAGPRGKRERLIAAASQMIYRQGVEKTTLADIAAAAEVPLGNVYYYFKTKNDLVQAVVETHLGEASALLTAIEAAHEAPRERLKALFGALAVQRELIARYGCPHGSLCLELGKRADGPGLAAELMIVSVDWAARQFQAIGRRDARDLAVQVIASYQGTALLTSTLRDPDLMTREALRVAQWIDTLLSKDCARFGLKILA